ncbi:MAG: hypothetical protein O3B45_07435 [Bacteroidetes bacterium]|jgi:hypothetical protein|nr:hypothetical protein [Bacteroidota bacterium]
MNGISALFSSKESEVLAALEEAKESGDIQWVRPMMEVFRDHPSDTVVAEIGTMLSALKISAASDALADALEDPEFEAIYADIVGFMWSSGFVPEESLRAIVTCAVEGDFRMAVEALTWIEELEKVHDENQLMDSILLVRGAIEEGKNAEAKGLYEAMLSALLHLERLQ